MKCETCDELLGEYKLWASLFRDAVVNIPGVLADDSKVFLEYADRLLLKCNHTNRSLMEHRQKHKNLAAKAPSSEVSGS